MERLVCAIGLTIAAVLASNSIVRIAPSQQSSLFVMQAPAKKIALNLPQVPGYISDSLILRGENAGQ